MDTRPQTRSLATHHPVVALVSAAIACALCPAIARADQDLGQHRHGHRDILIADQFNNRVIEVDPRTHRVVWQFGDGSDTPGPHSIVGVNDAERIASFTLMAGTGIPPATPPLPGCADAVNGCPDNRVILVNHRGHIVWQYGEAGVTGADANQLNTPVHALFLSRFGDDFGPFVMITDQGNQRVIVVNFRHDIVWQYGTTGVSGSGPDQLNNPNSAELLENGNVLVADENNNRVIEVNHAHDIIATFTEGGALSGAAFASRLRDGDTLITDSNNNRIVEVDATDTIVWQYATNGEIGSNPNPLPTRAVRLHNGDTLISDQFNDRVIEITPTFHIVFTQGALNMPGNGSDQLNGPYDAKVIGDFTGLTPPFDFDD